MGGGAIRAAAKVAGITAATSGLRGLAAEHYPVSSATRRTASARTAASVAEEVKLVASNSEGGVQRPYLEMDDWVLAGEEEEMVIRAAEPMPRVVFGGVPTLQEAKEATSELTLALENAYLSSPNSVGYDSVAETKACVSSDVVSAPAVPSPAIMAFRFLHENSIAQNVVASIASDANVWNAVLQNQELQDFLQSQRACLSCSDKSSYTEFMADSDPFNQSSGKSTDASSENGEPGPVNGFIDTLQNIKTTVVDMMSSLFDYFQSFFGGRIYNRAFPGSDGTARLSADSIMEASFLGLAVMAIVVILLKRA